MHAKWIGQWHIDDNGHTIQCKLNGLSESLKTKRNFAIFPPITELILKSYFFSILEFHECVDTYAWEM